MEKVKVRVAPDDLGQVPEVTVEDLAEAGWSDDPGTGKAVLVPDERGAPAYEIVNPLPIAPPIGWEPTPPIEQLIRDRVKAEFDRLKDDDEIDDIVDAEDFEIPDELPPLETIYEVIGMEPQAPSVKPLSAEERAQADVAYEEVLDRHRRLAKKRSREEYERRQREMRELYGDEGVKAVLPPDDEGKGA